MPFTRNGHIFRGNVWKYLVNHKRVVYWVINYRKMKYVLEKHDAWHGAMVWLHYALVKN